jgi:hypothetical protein
MKQAQRKAEMPEEWKMRHTKPKGEAELSGMATRTLQCIEKRSERLRELVCNAMVIYIDR